jgi:hypothetical protein
VQGGTDKTVSLAGAGEGLVEQTVDVVKAWLVCAAPRAVSECAAMDDTDVLLATDVTDDDDVCSVLLHVTRYPEEAAATLKRETETAMQQKEEAKKKAEEERLKAESEARAFRRRCVQALSAVGMCVLLLLLHRAGRLPLRLQRLLAALLPWIRRR